ncbi:MAG: bifunctional nuclease family protein [Candidatus Omnitrophota bacterium]
MKQVKVYSVILMPQLGQYLVTLEEEQGIRLIPIWVGPAEGMAIGAKLNKQSFPRPITHDLLTDIFAKLKVKLEKVTVTDLKDSTFYATITIASGKKTYEVDSRPSDAIALAIRNGSPIFVEDIVFDKCPVIQKPITADEIKDFKKDLENLKPEDFFKET